MRTFQFSRWIVRQRWWKEMRKIVLIQRHARRWMLAEIQRSKAEVRRRRLTGHQWCWRKDVDESPNLCVVQRDAGHWRRIGNEYRRHAQMNLARWTEKKEGVSFALHWHFVDASEMPIKHSGTSNRENVINRERGKETIRALTASRRIVFYNSSAICPRLFI